nr:hypothetical protein YSBCXYJI_YSBCXYJI_CDS_0008 [Caudoviricetes sp.]
MGEITNCDEINMSIETIVLLTYFNIMTIMLNSL